MNDDVAALLIKAIRDAVTVQEQVVALFKEHLEKDHGIPTSGEEGTTDGPRHEP